MVFSFGGNGRHFIATISPLLKSWVAKEEAHDSKRCASPQGFRLKQTRPEAEERRAALLMSVQTKNVQLDSPFTTQSETKAVCGSFRVTQLTTWNNKRAGRSIIYFVGGEREGNKMWLALPISVEKRIQVVWVFFIEKFILCDDLVIVNHTDARNMYK